LSLSPEEPHRWLLFCGFHRSWEVESSVTEGTPPPAPPADSNTSDEGPPTPKRAKQPAADSGGDGATAPRPALRPPCLPEGSLCGSPPHGRRTGAADGTRPTHTTPRPAAPSAKRTARCPPPMPNTSTGFWFPRPRGEKGAPSEFGHSVRVTGV